MRFTHKQQLSSNGTARRRFVSAMSAAAVTASIVGGSFVSVLGGVAAASAPTFGYGGATLYPTSGINVVVAVGDLNGDGKPDIATGNGLTNSVSVLINTGVGLYADPVTYSLPSSPQTVGIADINGDSHPDVVVAGGLSSGYGRVFVLMNNGDGTLAAPVSYDQPTGARDLALGDVNGDGRPDVVTANAAGNQVAVMLTNADGTLGSATTYAAGTNPTGVAIADLTGDGHSDIVAANYKSNTVSVFAGDGSGGFATQVSYPANTEPFAVAAGDFNGDGHQDLALSSWTTHSTGVLLANDSGGFNAPVSLSNGSGALGSGIAVADLNGDGKLDILSTDISAHAFLGNGDGTFAPQYTAWLGASAYEIVPADVNGDGVLDLVGGTNSSSVGVALGKGVPQNLQPPSLSGTAKGGYSLSTDSGLWSSADFPSFTYRWQRCDTNGDNCADVPDAPDFSDSYFVTAADAGSRIRVGVTASTDHGSTGPLFTPVSDVVPVPPTNTVPPTLTGTPVAGSVVAISGAKWSDPSAVQSYGWLLCFGPNVPTDCFDAGVTTRSLRLQSWMVGYNVVGVAIGTTANGQAIGYTQPAVVTPLAPSNTALPTISGTPQAGQKLATTRGTWAGTSLTYTRQWKQCDQTGQNCVPIANATGASYTAKAADVGHTLIIEVTATNSAGSATAASLPIGPITPIPPANTATPTIGGYPFVGERLTVNRGTWTGTTLTYTRQWKRCDAAGENCVPIANASGGSYVLRTADIGYTVVVDVTAMNSAGSVTKSSDPTAVITAQVPS